MPLISYTGDMMIRLEYMGFFKVESTPSNSIVEAPVHTTVDALLDRLLVKKEARKFMVPLVNRERKPFDHVLEDGDSLFLYFPVGGG
jgi:molybdopterin converting factor small subunit